MTREQADAVVNRVKGTTDLNEAVKDVDLVIEAATENLDTKKSIFKELDLICSPHTIIASNTSYLSIAVMASVTQRADRFAGTHWFNPPQIMRGVEVIKAPKTSQETIDALVGLCHKIGKEPGLVKDSPGFVVNRLLMVFYNEGMRLYGERVADAQDIDTALKAGYGFRMGPLELRDFTGLDALFAHEEIYSELRREIFRPPDALIEKVRAGDLGRKTGRGFHDYTQK
jgi:3-hydroxyacyl-CoA dehydrogenase